MTVFHYRAIDGKGRSLRGKGDFSSRRDALQWLQSQGLNPLELAQGTTRSGAQPALPKERTSPTQTIAKTGRARKESLGLVFLNRLQELHAGGMPLGDAVRLLRNRLSNPAQREIANHLWAELSEGRSLAAAMATLPEYFNEATRHVIEAGETTGHLVPILQRVTRHLEEKAAIRAKLLASLAYPVFIAIVAFGVVGLFVFFLLPNFQNLIASLGGEMTWTAQLLIGMAEGLFSWGPWILTGGFLGFLILRQARRQPAIRRKSDGWILRIPVVGTLVRDGELFQLTSLMATLLASGITITEGLRMAEKVLINLNLRDRFSELRREVNEGISFAASARRHGLYPELTLDILAVGENTGSLVGAMETISHSLREGLSKRIALFTNLLTTGALLAAFLLVALVAVGIVTSIFQVSRAVNF